MQRWEENGISYKGAHWYAVKQYIPKHRIQGDVVKVRFSVPYRLNKYSTRGAGQQKICNHVTPLLADFTGEQILDNKTAPTQINIRM